MLQLGRNCTHCETVPLPSHCRTCREVKHRAGDPECSLGLHGTPAQPPQSADFPPLGGSQVAAELEDASQAKDPADHTPLLEGPAQPLPAPATEPLSVPDVESNGYTALSKKEVLQKPAIATPQTGKGPVKKRERSPPSPGSVNDHLKGKKMRVTKVVRTAQTSWQHRRKWLMRLDPSLPPLHPLPILTPLWNPCFYHWLGLWL